MSRPIEELLPKSPRPVFGSTRTRSRTTLIKGCSRSGRPLKAVKSRVEQQLKTALVKDYTIHVDESAERATGRCSPIMRSGRG